MKIAKLDDWLNNHSEHEPQGIISQLLPGDKGDYIIIAGRTGIGKSVLALHLAMSLGTGQPFLGFKTEKQSVAYIAMEGGKANWKDRLHKVIPQYPADYDIGFELRQPLDLLKDSSYKEMLGLCKGSKVIIWDNLRQVTSGKYLDPNYAAEWLKTYQNLLRELDAVGVLTHHIKKRDNRYLIEPDDVYSLKGGTEYVDAATSVLLLERQRQTQGGQGTFKTINPNNIVLYFAKARIATNILNPIRLTRNYDKCGFDVEQELPSDLD